MDKCAFKKENHKHSSFSSEHHDKLDSNMTNNVIQKQTFTKTFTEDDKAARTLACKGKTLFDFYYLEQETAPTP